MSPLVLRSPRNWKAEDFATATFALFLSDVDTFDIRRGEAYDFEAKQRMLSRAQAIGLAEAYSLELPRLYTQSADPYLALLHESQRKVAVGGHEPKMSITPQAKQILADDSRPTPAAEVPLFDGYDPHREEIRTVLVSTVLVHLEARRTQHLSMLLGVLAVVLGAIAVFK